MYAARGSGELGADYPAACVYLRVSARPGGYGLLLCQDANGGRWTIFTTDVTGVASVRAMWDTGLLAGYDPPSDSVLVVQAGWPVECTPGLVDRGQPYDPLGAGVVLSPPDMSRWGPVPRRQMADKVADELSEPPGWDERQWAMLTSGDTDLTRPTPRLIEEFWVPNLPPDQPAVHAAVDAALAEAWQMADQTLPAGRVRVIPLGPTGGPLLVHATGPTWSLLAARDHACLILDRTGPLLIDITSAAQLRELLDSLAAVAQRADGAFATVSTELQGQRAKRKHRRPGR